MSLLGSKVRDKVTGFEGVVLGQATYLYAGPQLFVAPNGITSEGVPFCAQWFDEARIVVIEEKNTPGFKL